MNAEGEGDESVYRCHGDDPRFAEDAVLAISNLLRFDELQRSSLPFAACSAVTSHALQLHGKGAPMLTDSALRLLRYLLGITGEIVPNPHPALRLPSTSTGTATTARCLGDDDGDDAEGAESEQEALEAHKQGLEGFDAELEPLKSRDAEYNVMIAMSRVYVMEQLNAAAREFVADRTVVENALHIMCSMLVVEDIRQPDKCPYKDAAQAVVDVMSQRAYRDDAGIQALGATILRNLACVSAPSAPPSPTSAGASDVDETTATALVTATGTGKARKPALTPAQEVTLTGAARVLEAAMERLPHSHPVQENARCALYNLLLIASQDAQTQVDRAAQLYAKNAELQQALRRQQQQYQGNGVSDSSRIVVSSSIDGISQAGGASSSVGGHQRGSLSAGSSTLSGRTTVTVSTTSSFAEQQQPDTLAYVHSQHAHQQQPRLSLSAASSANVVKISTPQPPAHASASRASTGTGMVQVGINVGGSESPVQGTSRPSASSSASRKQRVTAISDASGAGSSAAAGAGGAMVDAGLRTPERSGSAGGADEIRGASSASASPLPLTRHDLAASPSSLSDVHGSAASGGAAASSSKRMWMLAAVIALFVILIGLLIGGWAAYGSTR